MMTKSKAYQLCRARKGTVWGEPPAEACRAERHALQKKAGVIHRGQSDSGGSEGKSMRQVGLSLHLDFNEFLERQTQFLAVRLPFKVASAYLAIS